MSQEGPEAHVAHGKVSRGQEFRVVTIWRVMRFPLMLLVWSHLLKVSGWSQEEVHFSLSPLTMSTENSQILACLSEMIFN